MTPTELRELIASFDNTSKRHHHALIRTLATELLEAKLANVLLKAMVPVPFNEVQLTSCEQDAA